MTNNNSLAHLIPPEIRGDKLYAALLDLARTSRIDSVLEIGSSAGQGSTDALVRGLRENANHPKLYCLEVSQPRFEALSKLYASDSFVRAYRASSVGVECFAGDREIAAFHATGTSMLSRYPLEQVLKWRQDDLEYLAASGAPTDGVARIKKENGIEQFGLVLIDGSEFTGVAELNLVYGSRFIALDDVLTYKNYANYFRLLRDPAYLLREEDMSVRHGYAIFEKLYLDRPGDAHEEEAERQLVRQCVRAGATVFDVGANVGDYTILLSKLVGPRGQVLAFEPTDETFRILQRRLELHECKNVRLFQKAVYRHSGTLDFQVFPEGYGAWNSLGSPKMSQEIERTVKVTATTLDEVCDEEGIKRIDFLKIDVEGAESDVLEGGRRLLREGRVDLIQFEISKNMLEGLQRKAVDSFTPLIESGFECREILKNGLGPPVSDSQAFYANYLAIPSLPVHFFSIVLNGQPFIRHHIEEFLKLPFRWHWHIVEGIAELTHDTAWGRPNGGQTGGLHNQGRSTDGTSEYLDQLSRDYPDKVFLYRKPIGESWDGKREMVNAPLSTINSECLLWQVDADELWTAEQLIAGRKLFLEQPHKTAARYWCWYFVGPDRIISTRYCYANSESEWLRTWRYRPGMKWAAHEPPILVDPRTNRDVASVNPFTQSETEAQGLVFQHYAYVTAAQVAFKEQYYGYSGAVQKWQRLQEAELPIRLADYFPWVQDETLVDRANEYVAVRLLPIEAL